MKKQLGRNGQKRVKKGKNKRTDDSSLGGIYWEMFDISLFSGDRRQVLSILEQKIDLGTKKYWVATVNPEFVMATEKDGRFKRILDKTNLNVMDGIGLVWAKELEKNKTKNLLTAFRIGVEVLRGKYKNQVASGADLILELAKMAKEKNKKIFLLGGWNDRAEKTAKFLMSNYLISNDQINWSVGEPEITNSEVVKKINSFKPDILLVAYGMKKQEFWIE